MIENIVAEKSAPIYSQDMRGLGTTLKTLRNQRKFSQADLSRHAGINVETINRIEHDQNTTTEKLFKLAEALGVTVGDLLPEDQWPRRESESLVSLKPCCEEHSYLYSMLAFVLHKDQMRGEWLTGNIKTFFELLTRMNPPTERRKVEKPPRPTVRPRIRGRHN